MKLQMLTISTWWTLFISFTLVDGNEDVVPGTRMMNCPLCIHPHTPQDPTTSFAAGSLGTLTCQAAFDTTDLEMTLSNCTTWQKRGTSICQCGPSTPIQTNECTLCQNKRALPLPRKEVRPQRICALLQVDARRDDPSTCPVWQHTYGKYCNCENEFPSDVCRICNEPTQEFDPLIVLDADNGVTCADVEFQANLADGESAYSCPEYQRQYRSTCCRTAPIPTSDDDSDSSGSVSMDLALLTLWSLSFQLVQWIF